MPREVLTSTSDSGEKVTKSFEAAIETQPAGAEPAKEVLGISRFLRPWSARSAICLRLGPGPVLMCL